jgi:hypothetical protein
MSDKANELLNEQGGDLVGLTVKISPDAKAMILDLRSRTSKGISEIVQRALDAYFEGYTIAPVEDDE